MSDIDLQNLSAEPDMSVPSGAELSDVERPADPLTPEQRDAAFISELTLMINGEETEISKEGGSNVDELNHAARDAELAAKIAAGENLSSLGDESTSSPVQTPDNTIGADGNTNPPPPTATTETPPPSTPDSPQTDPSQTSTGLDVNKIFQDYYGPDAVPTPEQIQGLLALDRDLRSMTPAQVQQVQQAIYGGQNVNPQQPQPQQPTQQIPQPYSPPVAPASTPPLPQPIQQSPIQIPELVDPEVAQSLAPIVQATNAQQQELQMLRAQFEQQQQFILQQQAQQQEAERQRLASEYNAAAAKWHEDKQLTPEERVVIEQRVIDAGLIPALFQQYSARNDPNAATKAAQDALEFVYMKDPVFFERHVAREALKVREEQANQARRTNVSTALSGGGNKPSQTNPARPANVQKPTPETNMQGLVSGIAEALGMQADN